MTTSSPTHVPRARRSPQWVRALRMQYRVLLVPGGWFWALVLLAVGGVITALAVADVDVTVSVAQFAHHGALWFPFALSFILTLVFLPLQVANGMTRRSFIRASLAASAVSALGYAAAMTLLLVAEGWIYQALGWVQGAPDEQGEVLAAGAPTHLWGLVLMYLAAILAGLLVALCYYRFGPWWGTLTLPLTMAPMVLVGFLALDPDLQWAPWGVTLGADGPERSLLALVLLAVAALGVHLIARAAPITNGPTNGPPR